MKAIRIEDAATLRAFRLEGRRGVIGRPAIGHHRIVALGRRLLSFVQSWQDSTPRDCETAMIAPHRMA